MSRTLEEAVKVTDVMRKADIESVDMPVLPPLLDRQGSLRKHLRYT